MQIKHTSVSLLKNFQGILQLQEQVKIQYQKNSHLI